MSTLDPSVPVILPPVRGVRATWWYTASAVVFFEFVIAGLWVLDQLQRALGPGSATAVGVASVAWSVATVVLLRDYRRRMPEDPPVLSRAGGIAVAVVAVVAACMLPVGGGPMIAAVMGAQAVTLLNWRPGLRWKVVLAATAAIVAVALWVGPFGSAGADLAPASRLVGVYAMLLPGMTALSLWWWDVLITLDRARASEARLAATQERLRLATDVHDLQGHHLQVIALQLELATRLMPRDPDAGMAQLALARASVDDARQGTRDLAGRFRSVPLRDELANAQDLLRAAGHDAEATCPPGVVDAPADILGPVIRETTTNILRYGASGPVRLSLERADGSWMYRAVNAAAPEPPGIARGSGLDGIASRVAAVGGRLDVQRADGRFAVTVRVPVTEERA